jgi:hypothetical protein
MTFRLAAHATDVTLVGPARFWMCSRPPVTTAIRFGESTTAASTPFS